MGFTKGLGGLGFRGCIKGFRRFRVYKGLVVTTPEIVGFTTAL